MKTYRLSNGREIFLARYALRGTYYGCLEGTRASNSEFIRADIPSRAARVLPDAQPLAVILPPAGILPRWFHVAELESRRGVHIDDPDYASRLFTCWFTAETSHSIDSMIESLLPHLDWENLAKDYDVTFI